MKNVVIATRKSELAVWQAHEVKRQLARLGVSASILGLVSSGDKNTRVALNEIGGKGLFTKEIQQAVLTGQADIAVHCIKDMSVHDTPGLELVAIMEREDPRDVWLSDMALADLPPGAVVGTASPRRVSQLRAVRSDLQTKLLRGNVQTRLRKLPEYDGIILAAAGLKRLGLTEQIKAYLDPTIFVPAIGQGALGIECRADDAELKALLQPLNHLPTAECVQAERQVNKVLLGNCHTPLGVHVVCEGETFCMYATLEKAGKLICITQRGSDLVSLAGDVAQQLASV